MFLSKAKLLLLSLLFLLLPIYGQNVVIVKELNNSLHSNNSIINNQLTNYTKLNSLDKDALKENINIPSILKTKIMFLSDSELKDIQNNKKYAVNIISRDYNYLLIKSFQDVSIPSINANYIWNNGITGSQVKLGIIDTGLDISATDVQNKISAGKNFCLDRVDTNYFCDHVHGCLVASVALGSASDLNGVAKDANVVAARMFNAAGNSCANPFSVSNNIFSYMSTNGVNSVNNSWGTSNCEYPNEDNNTYIDLVDYTSLNYNLMLVFSAGNDGACGDKSLSYEAQSYNAITVGAVDDLGTTSRTGDTIASFSSIGPTRDNNRKKPDLVAPGSNINSYSRGSSKQVWSGTSAAAPHVTGALGLLEQIGITGIKAKALLINSSDDYGQAGWDKYYGWGYINLQSAFDQNSFIDQNNISLNLIQSNLSNQSITLYPSYSNFYTLSDTNVKCTITWNRAYNGDSFFVQNYDLLLNSLSLSSISDSNVDNVEQVSLNNLSNESYLKVYVSGNQVSSDVNYALSCNHPFTMHNYGYYVASDSNFYYSHNDSSFSLNFDINNYYPDDVNFDLNVLYSLKQGSSIVYSKSYSYNNIDVNTKVSFDLNNSFSNLNDYNITIDSNFYLLDYNNSIRSITIVNLANTNYDTTGPIIESSLDQNNYLVDSNLNGSISFIDSNIYSVRVTVYDDNNMELNSNSYYNITDNNKIVYDLNFNLNDYNSNHYYKFAFSSNDIFGNNTDYNILIYYKSYFELSNSYIDSNIIYYRADMNTLDINFRFNPMLDYNLLVSSYNDSFSDYNTFMIYNLGSNLFAYTLDLNSMFDYNISIIELDENKIIADFNLVKDYGAQNITASIGSDINLNFYDIDFDSSKSFVFIDSISKSFNTNCIDSNCVITFEKVTTCGSHTINAYLYDRVDNNTFYTSSYSNTACVSNSGGSSGGSGGGGGGGSSGSNTPLVTVPNITDLNKTTPLIAESNTDIKSKAFNGYTILSDDLDKIDYTGTYDLNNFGIVSGILYDSNLRLINGFAKIYDKDLIGMQSVTDGIINLDSFRGRDIIIVAYNSDGLILLKKEIIVPSFNKPINSDINIEKTVINDSNKSILSYIGFPKVKLLSISSIIILSVIITFAVLYFVSKSNVKKYKGLGNI